MRTLSYIAALAFVAVLFAAPAQAQDGYPHIPTRLAEITDDLLRESLVNYEPNYDALPRGSQLIAYANIYRVLYNQELAVPRPAPAPHAGFVPAQPYDPKIHVPMIPYQEDPRRYNRYWDANKHGGTGIYEPWRDPAWTPWEDKFGIYY